MPCHSLSPHIPLPCVSSLLDHSGEQKMTFYKYSLNSFFFFFEVQSFKRMWYLEGLYLEVSGSAGCLCSVGTSLLMGCLSGSPLGLLCPEGKARQRKGTLTQAQITTQPSGALTGGLLFCAGSFSDLNCSLRGGWDVPVLSSLGTGGLMLVFVEPAVSS